MSNACLKYDNQGGIPILDDLISRNILNTKIEVDAIGWSIMLNDITNLGIEHTYLSEDAYWFEYRGNVYLVERIRPVTNWDNHIGG